MHRHLRELRRADAAQALQALVERQDRGEIVLFGYRNGRDDVRTDMTEVERGPEHAVAAVRLTLQPRVEQIVSKLRVPELVPGDESRNLGEHGLCRLTRQPQEEVRGEVLADHVPRQLRETIRDRKIEGCATLLDDFVVRD